MGLLIAHLAIYGGLAIAFGGDAVWTHAAIFAAPLIWASIVDARLRLVPDAAAALLGLGGLLVAASTSWWLAAERAVWALIWGVLFVAVMLLYRRMRSIEGLGGGDATLIAGIAAWLGADTADAVLAATLGGIVTVMVLRLIGDPGRASIGAPGRPVAFGPFLCLAAWGVWLWGRG